MRQYREKMEWDLLLPIVFFGVIIVIFFLLPGYAASKHNSRYQDFTNRCHQAGGNIQKLRRNALCISKDGAFMGYL